MQGTATIDSVAHGGYGVCRFRDRVCFVSGALPGDKVALRVDREQRGIQWATLLEVIEPSADRIDVAEPIHGGNSWITFAYPAQAEWKCRIVEDSLVRIGGIEIECTFIEEEGLRTGYRTRATIQCDGQSVGFYQRSSHDIIDIESCSLLHPRANDALQTLRELKPRIAVDITVHPEEDIVLAWTGKEDGRIAKHFPNYNSLKDNRPRASFMFDNIPIVNGCFSQSSLLLNRMLRQAVHERIGDAESLLDLYCGSGNFSLPFSSDVTGLDHAQAAIGAAAAAGRGAYRTANEDAMADAIASRAWDCIILDPPRQGAKKLAGHLARSQADRIVYVSCDPATLARDVKKLTRGGWSVTDCAVVDMFPNTPHIETICTLTR